MRTRLVLRLARKLRSSHQKSRSWRVTAAACNVRDPHGEPSPGLAKLIAHDRYSPSPDLIRRLFRDGAIKPPRSKPLNLSVRDRRSIILALRERKPFPRLSSKTVSEIDIALEVQRLHR